MIGMKSWMNDCGIFNVVEMDWSEEVVIDTHFQPCTEFENYVNEVNTDVISRPPIQIVCIPCQHWCRRTLLDTNQCLWSAWYLATPRGPSSFFFGGDTGYCPMFAKVGEHLGPIELSAIPIAAYGSESEAWFHKPNHMNPEEAVKTHLDLKSKHSIAIHWGTFQLTGEPILEPPRRLSEELARLNITQENFVCLKHGETVSYLIDNNRDKMLDETKL